MDILSFIDIYKSCNIQFQKHVAETLLIALIVPEIKAFVRAIIVINE